MKRDNENNWQANDFWLMIYAAVMLLVMVFANGRF
jgi:hypothetical protein